MLKSTSLFLCLLTLALGACSFKKSGADDKSAAPATVTSDDVNKQLKSEQEVEVANAQITADDVSVTFTETPEPNAFVMKISWPERVSHASVQVRTVGLGSEFSTPQYLNYRSFWSQNVTGGTPLEILFATFDAHNSPVSIVKKLATTPHDLVISDIVVLQKDSTIEANRVIFKPNGAINSNGFNLSITANTIIGPDQPTKSNFQIASLDLSNVQNPLDFRVLRNSSIVLYAKKAIGYFRIGLFGVNGINGKSGEEIDQIEPPKLIDPTLLKGADGMNGSIKDRVVHCKSIDGTCPPVQMCSQQPTNGEDGKPGRPGTDGQAGSPGGDTGNLSVLIADNVNFHLYVFAKVGRGGQGGKGAPGMPGGKGGTAGRSDSQGICKPAHNGADGLKGKNGKEGNRGLDGAFGSIECNSLKYCETEKDPNDSE